MYINDILIIGSLPSTSGIGGVSIHVQRLLDYLHTNHFQYIFKDYRTTPIISLFLSIIKSRIIHIHVSNVYFQFALTVWAKILQKKSIVTIHCNIGRYNSLKNFIMNMTIKLCHVPIVLNEASYKKSILLNNNTKIIPAFIPPIKEEFLPNNINKNIIYVKTKYRKVFATNAYALSFDKNGKEIYGITELLKLFTKKQDIGLVFSDPSSTYLSWLKKNNFNIPHNVYIINTKHSFFEIIKRTDGVIRNTSTDGDSISIKEALYLKKPVFCTDVVPRHPACALYKSGDMCKLGIMLDNHYMFMPTSEIINGAVEIVKIYRNLISKKHNETDYSRS